MIKHPPTPPASSPAKLPPRLHPCDILHDDHSPPRPPLIAYYCKTVWFDHDATIDNHDSLLHAYFHLTGKVFFYSQAIYHRDLGDLKIYYMPTGYVIYLCHDCCYIETYIRIVNKDE